jgi:thiol-disulfide isomerase/thioredoxin
MKQLIEISEYHQFLEKNEYCGVYYSAEQCGVCNSMKPQVYSVYKKAGMPIVELSLNKFRELAGQQLILKSPTVVLYENGKEILRDSGFIDLNRISRNLQLILS